jgi:hypothetical protein
VVDVSEVGRNVVLDLNEKPVVMMDQLGAMTNEIQKRHQILFVEEGG